MRKILVLLLLINSFYLSSQNDCSDALIVCGNSGYQDLNATGVGVQELSGSNTCGSQENNSLWFQVNIKTGGKLGFVLTPTFSDGTTNTDLSIDFDFFVFGPDVNCGAIGQAIRCSTTNPIAAGATSNLTGMNSTETDTAEGPGAAGNNFVRELDVIAGESYFIVVDRPIGTSNFKIDWTGTATFNDPPDAIPPVAGTSYDLSLCDADGVDDNSTKFDLTLNETSILGGQTDISISYHTSNSDALTNNNPIPNPLDYENISATQDIFVRLTNTTTLCYTITTFKINAFAVPQIATQPGNLIIDDLDNDGVEIVDLTAQNPDILGAQDITEFEVIYSTDATFSSVIPDPVNYTSDVSLETIYFRVVNQNNASCYSEGSFSISLIVNQPPELTANNRVAYCPLSQVNIAPNFSITDSDDSGIDAFYVQISAGYSVANDQLILTGTHPTINATWTAVEGKLTLTPVGASQILYTDLEAAVRDIVFESTDPAINTDRFFSFTIGSANYLPSTGHFYVFVEDLDVLWSDAKILAEASNFYGLQGYLATILSEEESQISAEQTTGTGWIGASDEETEGVWKWVTGPEAGTNFWNGTFTGAAVAGMYSNWNTQEPNNQGGEDYAHITDDSVGIAGSWNDLPNTGGGGAYQAKGYIVEYGGMPGDPVLNISASTSIYVPQILTTNNDEACFNNSVSLTATVSEGAIYWYDAPAGGNLVGTGTTFTTPLLSNSTTYYATASPEGCATANRVAVTAIINQLPVVNDPITFSICDDDQDGFISMDLTSVNADISANFANETFTYYKSIAAATAGTPEIPDPTNYINTTNSNDAVWVRTISSSNCYQISKINIEIRNNVIPVSFEKEFVECDDFLDINGNNTINNNDTDGIATFDFSSVTNDIIALFPTGQTLDIRYFETLADANNIQNPILDTSAYRNINSPNTQQIFIRVENTENNTCLYVGSHITLTVNPVPIVNPIGNLILCDDAIDGDDTNGIVQYFNLENQTSLILGSQDPNDFTVTYHEFSSEVTSGANPLSSPYTNTTANLQTIFVRVINNTTGCLNGQFSFDLIVNPLPNAVAVVELKQCDDDIDGFSDFNLNEAASDISANFNNETFVFYPTLLDAENDSNAFTAAEAIVFRNRTQTTDTVWARAISNFDCYRIAEVNLVVSTTGLPASFQRSFATCDDFLDIDGNDNANNDDTDGIATFDFSSVTPEVVAIFPNTQQLTVTYYRNSADALAEINAIADIANYRNIGYPNTQQIYIRVDSNLDNDCLGFGPFITLNVDRVPTANNLAQPLSLCDDFDSGSSEDGENININLRQTVNEILGPSQSEADFIVTYHTSQADASSGNAPILNDTNFRNTAPAGFVPGTLSRQTIYVRVEDRNKVPACFNDHLSFDIEIKPLPGLENTIAAIEVCDVPTATDSDPRNRVAQNIDATIRNADILNGRDPSLFRVKYYKSQTEALNDLNSLTIANLLDYENDPANTFFPANVNSDDPGIETLFFTYIDVVSGCPSEPFTLDIRIYPEPNIPVNINNYTDCDTDNNGLGNDTDGILENIAFSSKITEVLANYTTAEQSNFTVSFHESLADAQTGNAPLDTNAYENTTNNQTIFVRVLNNQTGCVSDDLSFDIIVNPLPSYDPLDLSQVACLNNLPLTLQVDNPLTGYTYSWVENQSGDEISTAQSVDIRAGGTYTLTVTDRVTLCNRVEIFDVIESEAAIITSEHVAVIDETSEIFGNNFSITIDSTPGILGIGDYEYALLDELGNLVYDYQDTFVFEQLSGGFYTVLVRDKNGCDENGIPASLEVPVVEFPDFFTPNGDGVNDTWNLKEPIATTTLRVKFTSTTVLERWSLR